MTMYPKEEIQKCIEEVLRQAYLAEPDSHALADFLSDHNDELLEALALRAEYNAMEDDAPTDEAVFNKYDAAFRKLIPLIYEAVIEDLDFTRENNDDIVSEVVNR